MAMAAGGEIAANNMTGSPSERGSLLDFSISMLLVLTVSGKTRGVGRCANASSGRRAAPIAVITPAADQRGGAASDHYCSRRPGRRRWRVSQSEGSVGPRGRSSNMLDNRTSPYP